MTTGGFYSVGTAEQMRRALGALLSGPCCPSIVSPDTVQDISLSVHTVLGVPPASELTPGTITITRVRAGVETVIVNGAACSADSGRIYYSYTFPSASWQNLDMYKAVMSGQKLKLKQPEGNAISFSPTQCKGWVTSGVSGLFVVITQSIIHEPTAIGVDSPIICQLQIRDLCSTQITPAEMSGGAISIYRYRMNTDDEWTLIVDSMAMTEANGEMTYIADFPETHWASGDLVQIYNAPVTVVRNSVTVVQGPFRGFTKIA